MKKNIILLVLIFISATAFFLIQGKLNTDIGMPTGEQAAARKGWEWLENYREGFTDPAAPFLIKTINDRYCRSTEIENFVKEKWEEFENHYYLAVFERLFSGNDYKISEKVIKILDAPHVYYDDILPQALYCDMYPTKNDFAKKSFSNIENETGYDLTHKFWLAILFKKNGCSANGYNIEKIINVVAGKIAEEQEKNVEFNDLYAERVAFLLHFGFENLVKKEWINNIVKNQKKSGAWETPKLEENPHTTALAILALVEYEKKCPF